MAGHGGRDEVKALLQRQGTVIGGQIVGQIRDHALHVSLAQHRWDGPNQHCRRAEPFEVEAEFLEFGDPRLQPVAGGFLQFDHFGQQQSLGRYTLPLHRAAHPLQRQPFMRGMLVDDDEAILGFRDDIGARHLSARDAERETATFRGRRSGGFGAGLRRRRDERASAIGEGGGWGELIIAGRRHSARRLEDRHRPDRRRRNRLRLPGGQGCGVGILDSPEAFGIQRTAQAGHDHATDQRRVAKAHFGLGGMDVDVHLQRRDIQEQGDHRMAIARQHVGIGAPQRPDQQPVAHRAAIDEQILMIAHAAIVCGQRCDAGQLHPFPL